MIRLCGSTIFCTSLPKNVLAKETEVDGEDRSDSILMSEFKRTLKILKHGKVVHTNGTGSEIVQSIGEIGQKRLYQLIC